MLQGSGVFQLPHLLVHILHQTLVAFGQFDGGIQVFRGRSSDAEKAFLILGFVNIRDNADALFELIQLDQFGLERIYLFGEFLNLLSLMDDLFGLYGELSFNEFLILDLFVQLDVIQACVPYTGDYDEDAQSEKREFCTGEMELFDGCAGSA